MSVNWLKTGAESAQLAKQHEQNIEKQKAEIGKLWRFWLTDKAEAQITFVDGALDSQGFLTPPRFYEHQVYMNGSWNNYYICPEKTMPEKGEKCPICEGGDRPSLVAVFTIIDHREFTSKTGKKYSDTPKLFVAKTGTFEILAKKAVKLGGLAGAMFDVSRVGDKAPSVGSMFDFVKQTPVEELEKLYTVTDENGTHTLFKPADYQSEFVYRTAQELAQEGFAKVPGPSQPNEATKSFSQHL